MDHEEYLKRVKSYIKTPTKDMEQQLADFTKVCSYVSGQYDKDESFIDLNKHLEEKEKGKKESNRVFYMALPPSVFTTVSQHLKKNCYPKNGIARIIVRPTTTIYSGFANSIRSRNHSERIWPVLESYRELWSPTGKRTKFSVLITTWARKWLRIF